jgi:hypothetical protein
LHCFLRVFAADNDLIAMKKIRSDKAAEERAFDEGED